VKKEIIDEICSTSSCKYTEVKGLHKKQYPSCNTPIVTHVQHYDSYLPLYYSCCSMKNNTTVKRQWKQEERDDFEQVSAKMQVVKRYRARPKRVSNFVHISSFSFLCWQKLGCGGKTYRNALLRETDGEGHVRRVRQPRQSQRIYCSQAALAFTRCDKVYMLRALCIL